MVRTAYRNDMGDQMKGVETCGESDTRGACRVLVGKSEGKTHLEDLGTDGTIILKWAIPVAARSKARVCGIACWDCGFESLRGHRRLSFVSVVWCQVEVSATGRSLVQRSPTDCGVSN